LNSRATELQVLVDELDDLVHNAKAVPLTNQIRISRGEIYDILDQMRATIDDTQSGFLSEERQTQSKRETWADDKSIWDE
jgi:ElaB/YqjD/DUF883 family membrane-anchored ribosome-binding protein